MSAAPGRTGNEIHEGEPLTVRIKRQDPTTEPAPRYESYKVPYAARMRILDALEWINERQQGDVAYRWYCGARRCGMCAMVVNGEAKLTCWEPAEREMTIEPLRNLPLVRDLVVDRAPYEEALRAVEPQIKRSVPYLGFPEPLPDMPMVNRLGDCIECLVCHSECPALDVSDPTFLGPTVLVQLGRFVLDVRDTRDVNTISLTDEHVARCQACRTCEANCPVQIPIVAAAITPIRERMREAIHR